MKFPKSKILKVFKNPCVLVLVAYLPFFFFLGDNNRLLIARLQRQVNDLDRQSLMLEENIKQDSIEAVNLFGSIDAMEAYGREHYYMKRANEDIYIIKDNEEKE